MRIGGHSPRPEGERLLTWLRRLGPCDKTRPQERGFNKRYRFLELRLGDFPEDRLCLASELLTVEPRLPPSSTAPAAATSCLILAAWKRFALQPHALRGHQ
ncbi:hypothetical protein H920_17601 [Fukomys damarensis]|uniref:Uncharacterized protein n=1 Tax=Fukomys damarensis TaxID=885580 RepID=A0A091CSW0_FUKDA|nr:hypothetical protein H920_17601 [Fukomys damarensis]